MPTFFRKYKALIIGSVLLGYLTGIFQEAFLEGLHGAAHLTQRLLHSVEELHFTSGMPFFLKGKVSFRF